MGVIEKLGITQIERRYAGDYDEVEGYIAVCRDESVEELERQRDEMLEALIATKKALEKHDFLSCQYAIEEDAITEAIMKATGKTWEEIKAL